MSWTGVKNIKKDGNFSLSQLDWYNFEDKLEYFRYPRVLPDLMLLLNKIKLVRNENGLISTTLTLAALRQEVELGQFRFDDGTQIDTQTFGSILGFLRFSPRGQIISGKTQTEETMRRWGANVPLFWSAFKQLRSVKYSEWDLTDEKLEIVLDKYNLDWLSYYKAEFEWDDEELVNLSQQMRTNIGGKTPGKLHPIKSYEHKRTEDPVFNKLPVHVKLNLCDQWLFNKEYSSPYGLRNLKDMDLPNVSILHKEVFDKKEDSMSKKESSSIW